jgi:pimeloyl-ACP methyl ester carboxylesterase
VSRLADLGWDLTGRFVHVPPMADLPDGRIVDLPGRGRTFVADTGAPAGREDAPPLILLHALGCTGLLTWYPSLPALSARYRVITLDQRWHGRGIRSPHFRLEDCADDAVALADALGIDKFVAVGYSMGSLVAQLVALRRPDRLAGLVLGASTMRLARGRADPLALRVLALRIRTMAERRLRGGPFGPPPDGQADPNRWALAQFRSTSPTEIAGATAVLARFDSSRWAARISTPTGVVVTTRDHAVPAVHQRALVRTLQHATAFEIESGHAAVVLDAAKFTPALLAACASVSLHSTGSAQH